MLLRYRERDDPASPSALVRDLRRAGLTHNVIAQAAGLSVTTIWRMANEPDRDHFSSSVRRVRELHGRVFGAERESMIG